MTMKLQTIPEDLSVAQLRLIDLLHYDFRTLGSVNVRTYTILARAGLARYKGIFRKAVESHCQDKAPALWRIREDTVTLNAFGNRGEDLIPCVVLTEEGEAIASTMRLLRAILGAQEKLGTSNEFYALYTYVAYLKSDNFFELEKQNEKKAEKAA